MSRELREHAALADAARFVGRRSALATFAELLDDDSPSRILLIWGSGGIGKSALLREFARRSAPRPVVRLEGRRGLGAAESSWQSLGDVPPGAVVLLDEADELGAGLSGARERLLGLPADARVVVASRTQPEPAWWAGELGAIVRELPLEPLADDEAAALLESLGVVDPTRRAEAIRWSQGSPLALVVAASADSALSSAAPETALSQRLADLLAGSELRGVDRGLLEVASLTRAVDARLLAAALPGRPTRDAMAKLTRLSVVEAWGHRAILHPVLAQAYRADLRVRDPLRARRLTRRIADHLASRARLDDASALFELTDLLENPEIRSGAGLGISVTHYADRIREGDVDLAVAASGLAGTARGRSIADWVAALPQYGTAVRRVGGRLAALALFAPGDAAIGAGVLDPTIDPLLEWAGGFDDPGRVLIGPFIMFLEDDRADAEESMRVGNSALVTRVGTLDVLGMGAHYPAPPPTGFGFVRAMGYRPLIPAEPPLTWVNDLGPGGLIGHVHATVLAELGFSTPARPDVAALLRAAPDDDEARRELAALIAVTFDESEGDRRLARVLELAHLTAGLGERAVLEGLHVSRATFYRLLRVARERLLLPPT